MKQFIETVKRFPILWNTESKSYHNLNKKDVAWNRIVEEMNNPDIPDVKTAKNEWKKIRDSHRESLKRIKAGQGGQSGQGTLTKNNWKYAEHLEFLLPYMKSRKRPGKVSVNNKIISSSIALGSQNTSPEITETQSTEILDETQHYGRDERSQNGDSISTSKQERQEKRKVGDDSSLRDLLKEVDADFIKWCEQRDKRRAEEAEKVKKHRHPLHLFFDSMCESTIKLPNCVQRDVKKKVFQIVCEAEESYENYLSTQPYHGYTTPSSYSIPLRKSDYSLDH